MRKFTRKERAQGMVEFALIIPIFLVVVFGIIEFGRLLFTYSVVFTSSREAARYGAAAGDVGGYVPHYLDCTGIKAAGLRMGNLAGIQDSDILIRYDRGSDASRFSNVCPPSQKVNLGDRIDIQIQANYQPIVPLLNIPSFTITSNTARTILKDITIQGTPQPPPGSSPSVYFTLETQDVTEGTGGGMTPVTVSLQLSSATTANVFVPFSILGGSATQGVDYNVITVSPAVIPVGATSTDISIEVNPDALDENDESFTITMGNPTNANKGTPDTHTVTIIDDDDPPVASFAAEDSSTGEADSPVTITVQLDVISGRAVTIPFSSSVSDSTASLGADYNFVTPSPVTIPAGLTTATFDVSIVDDLLDEEDEIASIVMGTPINAQLGTPDVHELTILDDDDPPDVAFTIPAQETSEGVDLNVELQLSAPSGKVISVPYSLSGTATRNVDYTVSDGPVVFTPEETTANIVISVAMDPEEIPNETITITLGTPTNAVLVSPSVHNVTILEAVMPQVYFAEDSGQASESAGSISALVQLSWATGVDVEVPINVSGTATNGLDYTLSPLGTVTVPAGNTSQDVVINIVDDGMDEEDETVVLTMGPPLNALPGSPSQYTATIEDDDDPPIVYFVPESQSEYEDAGDLPVTVRLTSASGLDVLVPYTLGGSATPGEDYNTLSPSNSLVIPAGSTDGTLLIQVIDDDSLDYASVGEPDETVIVSIDGPVNATVDPSGVLPDEHTTTILAWDCPSAASNPYLGPAEKKLNWDIQYTGVRSVDLLQVYIEWPAASGTDLSSITFGGGPIGDPGYYPASLGSLNVTNPTPLWSGVFATQQMIFKFDEVLNPDNGIYVAARFEHCLPFSKSIGN